MLFSYDCSLKLSFLFVWILLLSRTTSLHIWGRFLWAIFMYVWFPVRHICVCYCSRQVHCPKAAIVAVARKNLRRQTWRQNNGWCGSRNVTRRTNTMTVRNYHTQAIWHIRHLLMTELAQTLACSLILSRIDYCNAVLHGAPTSSIQKLQRVQNTAARIVLQAPSHYSASCTGCRSNSVSHTSWLFWRSKSAPLRCHHLLPELSCHNRRHCALDTDYTTNNNNNNNKPTISNAP